MAKIFANEWIDADKLQLDIIGLKWHPLAILQLADVNRVVLQHKTNNSVYHNLAAVRLQSYTLHAVTVCTVLKHLSSYCNVNFCSVALQNNFSVGHMTINSLQNPQQQFYNPI